MRIAPLGRGYVEPEPPPLPDRAAFLTADHLPDADWWSAGNMAEVLARKGDYKDALTGYFLPQIKRNRDEGWTELVAAHAELGRRDPESAVKLADQFAGLTGRPLMLAAAEGGSDGGGGTAPPAKPPEHPVPPPPPGPPPVPAPEPPKPPEPVPNPEPPTQPEPVPAPGPQPAPVPQPQPPNPIPEPPKPAPGSNGGTHPSGSEKSGSSTAQVDLKRSPSGAAIR
ncbi:MAG: hypothetical protein HY985_18540 [Magnetospirillum sp.]|nr:hypothetical protein [Magnetospirillum sp.]